MFKKQIQKLSLLVLLLPLLTGFFAFNTAKAQQDAPPSNPQPRGSACNITTASFTGQPQPKMNKSTLSHDEEFSVYFEGTVDPNRPEVKDCTDSELNQYDISLYVYASCADPGECIGGILGHYNSQLTYNISYDKDSHKFRQRIDGLTLDFIFSKDTNKASDGYNNLVVYFHKRGDLPSKYFGNYAKFFKDDTSVTNPVDPAFKNPPISNAPATNADKPTVQESGTVNFDDFKFAVKIKSATNDPHRNFYRISNDGYIAVPDEANAGKNKIITFAEFDKAGIPVTISLADGKVSNVNSIAVDSTLISYNQYSKDYPNLAYFLDGSHLLSKISLVSIEKSLQEDKTKGICAVSVFSANQYTCSSNKIKETNPGVKVVSKNAEADFPIKLGSPQALNAIGIQGDSGAIMTMNILPNIDVKSTWGQWAGHAALPWALTPETGKTILSPAGFSYGDGVQTAVFQIYANKTELDAHKDDAVPSSVAAYQDAITGNTQNSGKTASSTLYSFIVRVITSIILYIQTVLYKIFAYILVPVLKALLNVKPYQDKFVNIIYPGWLILRNLANIFFIVSLLMVGLRILFQQSASSTARGFIVRLVLFALLLNFSLVIAQGIIGIADTVQAQFLPANSRVIETLGAKLMVEPLKAFRSTVVGDGTAITASVSDTSLADTVKPLVLLILSLAAFFSFVAIAAFLLVRLVALWILYMVSPVAYVGFVMDETKGYAKTWWKEFIKYAMITPVLVFFLNIAALMATVFQGTNKGLFDFGDGSTSSDIVIGSLTIISHFIVLVFIYAGMKYAHDSGTAGAKTIVNYAKKGFDSVTTKPAKWAANTAKSAAQTQWDRRFKGGMLDPWALRDAYKDRIESGTKKAQEKRFASKQGKLTPEGLFKKPMKALKYIANGGSLTNAKLEAEAASELDKSRILTQGERNAFIGAQLANEKKLHDAEEDAKDIETGFLSRNQVNETREKFDKERRLLEEDKRAKVDDMEKSNANPDAIDDVKQEYESRIQKLKQNQEKFESKLGTDGTLTLDEETENLLKTSLGIDKAKLLDDLKAAKKEAERDLKAVKEDDERRARHGYTTKDNVITADALRQYDEITKKLNDHRMPDSLKARDARLNKVKEAGKLIESMEGDELKKAFKSAVSDNNMDLAEAIAKKIAQEGDFASLLREEGYKNNVEDFQKFMDEKFGKYSHAVRYQIGSEISNINMKNGNAALGFAYKVDDKNNLSIRSHAEQLRKVNAAASGKSADDVLKKKKGDLAEDTATGHRIFDADIKNLNSFSTYQVNKLEKLGWEKAKFILEADNVKKQENGERGDLLPHIEEKLRAVSRGRA